MQTLKIKATAETPEVVFDGASGKFSLNGLSYSNHTMEFYEPLLSYLDEYILQPPGETVFSVKLEHINSSSYKCVIEMLKKFNAVHKAGKSITVKWHYKEGEDEIYEDGLQYSRFFKFKFEMIPF